VAFSNAALHWMRDHPAVLEGVARSLKSSGKILFQMGGAGNAHQILAVAGQVMASADWETLFQDFPLPYWFYSPQEYLPWLEQAGLQVKRVELLSKDMLHLGREGLAGWIRTTWLPYTHRVPEPLREQFISEIVGAYLKVRPLDPDGFAHVDMVRLEVEAYKP
jgi:trans-aconitate methyltransferase